MEPFAGVSVVVPCFDEAGAAPALAREIADVLRATGRPFELLFVDDHSGDDTVAALTAVARALPELRVLRHAVRAGQSAAIATGFRAARHPIVVTLDGDGQNDPADLPALLAALDGADVVCGVRRKREDDRVRRLSSRIANAVRNALTGDRIRDAGCGLRAIRREALAELPVFNGMHRFLPTLLRLQGFRVAETPVGHRPRTTGRSKYGIRNRALRGLVDCFAMLWWRRRVVPARRTVAEPARAREELSAR